MRAFIFWLAFIPLAVWLQHVVPGLDVLAWGLIVAVQRQSLLSCASLAAVAVMIQEGGGSLPFGTTILLYGLLTITYVAGTSIFESRNFLFMLLLGLFFGAEHWAVMRIMGGLAGAGIDEQWLLGVCVRQALIFPVGWAVVDKLYSRCVSRHAASV